MPTLTMSTIFCPECFEGIPSNQKKCTCGFSVEDNYRLFFPNRIRVKQHPILDKILLILVCSVFLFLCTGIIILA